MGSDSVKKIQDASEDFLAAWSLRANDLIYRRLHDARAHAEAGRLGDAGDRLDELERGLANDILGPAREQFYRDGFTIGVLTLAPQIRDPEVVPSPDGARTARTVPIGGQDQMMVLKSAIDEARHGLRLAAVTSFGDTAIKPVIHETWERRHRSAISSHVRGLLSNAQIALREAVGHIMVKPHLR